MTDVILVSTPGFPVDILPFLPQIVPAVVAAIDVNTDPTRIRVVAVFDEPIDIANPPPIADGIDLQTDDLVFAFNQVDGRLNGVLKYTAEAALVRTAEYMTGVFFKAQTVRVQALFGDDYEGTIWELANDATVDLDATQWSEVTDDFETLPNGTGRMGPASQRSVDSTEVRRRLVPTDLPLIQSHKDWRGIDLPLAYIVQQRPRLSWAGYVTAPWTMSQWLTLCLREEDIFVWDVPLQLPGHLQLDDGIYSKTIIMELPPDVPAVIGTHPAASGITWLGQKLRFEGQIFGEARVPTTGNRSMFRFLPGCADIYFDTVKGGGGWGRVIDVLGVNKGDIDGFRIDRLIQSGATAGGVRLKGARRPSIGYLESVAASAGGAQIHAEILDNCEDVTIEGGRSLWGAQAVVVNAASLATAPSGVNVGPFKAVQAAGVPFERRIGHHVTFHDPEASGAGDDGLVFRANGGVKPVAVRPHLHGGAKRGALVEGPDMGQAIIDPAVYNNSQSAPGTWSGIELGPGADNITVRGGFSGEAASWAHAGAVYSMNGNIGEGKTVTIGGRMLTARLAPAGDYDFQRDAVDRNISTGYLLAYLQASSDPALIKCAYSLTAGATNQITATAIEPGLSGNAIAVASDIAAGGWSSATLTGGAESPAPTQKGGVEVKAPAGRNIRVAVDDTRGNIVGGII